MKLRFLYAILLMAIVMIKAEDNVDTDNILGNKDFGDIVNKESSENRGRSLNVDVRNNGERQIDLSINDGNFDTITTEKIPNLTTTEKISDTTITEKISDTTITEKISDTTITVESSNSTTTEEIDSSSIEVTNGNSTEITTTVASVEEDYPYQVRGENGTACILSRMTISLTVKYNNTNNEISKKTLKVPSTVEVNGTCEEDINSMILTWLSFENDTKSFNFANTANNNNMTFYFKKEGSTFSMNQINGFIYIDETNFENASDIGSYIELESKSNLNLFASDMDSRYICEDQTIVNEDEFQLSLTNVSLIAFNSNDTIAPKSTNYCTSNGATAAVLSESANVGAIVGGIIGAVVVIGIIGFIIWRRRRNTSSVRSEVA